MPAPAAGTTSATIRPAIEQDAEGHPERREAARRGRPASPRGRGPSRPVAGIRHATSTGCGVPAPAAARRDAGPGSAPRRGRRGRSRPATSRAAARRSTSACRARPRSASASTRRPAQPAPPVPPARCGVSVTGGRLVDRVAVLPLGGDPHGAAAVGVDGDGRTTVRGGGRSQAQRRQQYRRDDDEPLTDRRDEPTSRGSRHGRAACGRSSRT